MSASSELFINGVDGDTGDYLVPPLSGADAIDLLTNEPAAADTLKTLSALHRRATEPKWDVVPFDVHPERVDEAGWGIVFHRDEDPAVKSAFDKLIEHRTKRSKPGLVKTFEYSGQSVSKWLADHGVGLGMIRPDRVPMYLLIVGSPERIPFEFGHLLDVDYAVGRLHFESPAGYAAYVDSLIEYETGSSVTNGRDVVFFGPRHDDDDATELSADDLVKPLALGAPDAQAIVDRVTSAAAYRARYCPPDLSTKETLHQIFHAPSTQPTSAVVFTASHGVGWRLGDSRQATLQGALVCQEFPGPGRGAPKPAHYFAAPDVGADARVHGMVCFHFACFGAGTPKYDRFFHRSGQPRQIATESFVSALPKALLSHPNGGALGVIGHVDRAWPCSIVTADAGPQLQPFENTLGTLLSGRPLGYSLKYFNARYAMLSTGLTDLLEKWTFKLAVPERDLWRRWMERNDAEAYVLLGDPAARIRTDVLRD